jgi:cysteine desulfurase
MLHGYWDYAASTPIDPRVRNLMHLALEESFANPHAKHPAAKKVRASIEQARSEVASAVKASSIEDIIWTSGATEANNLVLKGISGFSSPQRCEIITTEIEHSSILGVCRTLGVLGLRVQVLPVKVNGQLDLELLKQRLSAKTLLVSIGQVNNELGTIQPIKEIAALCAKFGVMLHVDAAQSMGRVPMNETVDFPISFRTFSAHKVYGPKGVGALVCAPEYKKKLRPLIEGGGQEGGLRAGTLASPQIIGMGLAFRLAAEEFQADRIWLSDLRAELVQELESLEGLKFNSPLINMVDVVPGILNIRLENLVSAKLEKLTWLSEQLMASRGAACSSGLKSSHVLAAIGLTQAQNDRSIRLSFGRFSTKAEVTAAIGLFKQVLNQE